MSASRHRRLVRGIVVILWLTVACAFGGQPQEPPQGPPPPIAASSASAPPITLGPGRTDVPLAAATVAGPAISIAERVRTLRPDQRLYLTFRQAKAQVDPGVSYNVYLNLPKDATPQGSNDAHYAGTFSFFNAVGRPTNITLGVTAVMSRLLNDAGHADHLDVTIVPAGEPNASAAPEIASIFVTAP
jgi:Protein of unknown function (DUF_B2219)